MMAPIFISQGPQSIEMHTSTVKGIPAFSFRLFAMMSFLDVYTGWPGSVHNRSMFNNIPL